MIHIGLTGWGDHPSLYVQSSSPKEKLIDYSAHFPTVELDATFYAIQPERNMRKWISETPDQFQFIVKAYQGITGHARGELPFQTPEEMFQAFRLSIEPLKIASKLAMVLVQFPPWFDCTRRHVEQIRWIRSQLPDIDLAIEFRHQSWYQEHYRDRTIDFLQSIQAIHSVCDEPQVGEGSVPFVPISTRDDKVLIRLHGRNKKGWLNTFGHTDEWRKVRYLYHYTDEELQQLKQQVEILARSTEEIFVIFNNNSGGHAAENARRFQRMLGIEYDSLTPKQLDLFGGNF